MFCTTSIVVLSYCVRRLELHFGFVSLNYHMTWLMKNEIEQTKSRDQCTGKNNHRPLTPAWVLFLSIVWTPDKNNSHVIYSTTTTHAPHHFPNDSNCCHDSCVMVIDVAHHWCGSCVGSSEVLPACPRELEGQSHHWCIATSMAIGILFRRLCRTELPFEVPSASKAWRGSPVPGRTSAGPSLNLLLPAKVAVLTAAAAADDSQKKN